MFLSDLTNSVFPNAVYYIILFPADDTVLLCKAKNENPVRKILVQCLSVWVFELESGECCQCGNVANVEMLPIPMLPIAN